MLHQAKVMKKIPLYRGCVNPWASVNWVGWLSNVWGSATMVVAQSLDKQVKQSKKRTVEKRDRLTFQKKSETV